MQNKTFKNFIQKILAENKINASSVGESIKSAKDYTSLINGGFIGYIPTITGGGSIHVKNREALEKYFSSKFPEKQKNTFTSIDNVNTFRNTKVGKRESQNVILLRGQEMVLLNGIETDLKKYTDFFGTFAASVKSLEANKVCFVENLDSYLIAEQVINSDFTFIHTYGGIGKSVVSKVKAKSVLVFPDYDYKGLHNYLLVKSVIENAELFVPNNYEVLFETKSRTIDTKHGRKQQASNQVKESKEEMVVKIRTDIVNHGKFLEQQAIFK